VALEDDVDQELHCLEIQDGELPPELIVVDSSRVSIGRSAPADIILSHKSVSREHCMIGLANDELFVTDLNSTNGTWIDESRVGHATRLPVGSIVRLGQISLLHSVRTRAEADRLRGAYDAVTEGGREAGRLAATS
jgi:pSer/pThr/pTyr-binding forkhead associated (FHA) protein